ncbi:hypothetical protein P153DRAFT_427207 [Dothidotthia symphoricarpi CBS 119687]|uniref:Uncharacterized protein n=1 Tax=Dothidotthia symphoricarpi CBS 119687 TaxID=1392245 RepID=A0A6A6AU74_9PLEO|nr:uncharacterized protein P153DRAFT_427207 [Dothidotthia symphoricarpi CBS 119687]KAF2134515.1 hypothetical protein P153DRAFT_427207 [Dothidotthia symphoricarpi CBS 119687]
MSNTQPTSTQERDCAIALILIVLFTASVAGYFIRRRILARQDVDCDREAARANVSGHGRGGVVARSDCRYTRSRWGSSTADERAAYRQRVECRQRADSAATLAKPGGSGRRGSAKDGKEKDKDRERKRERGSRSGTGAATPSHIPSWPARHASFSTIVPYDTSRLSSPRSHSSSEDGPHPLASQEENEGIRHSGFRDVIWSSKKEHGGGRQKEGANESLDPLELDPLDLDQEGVESMG